MGGLPVKRIELDLSKHCIQTAIKRLYNQSLSRILKNGQDRGHLEQQIEILKTALETFDFPKLRSTYPELTGNNNHKIALVHDEKNRIAILVNGEKVGL